MKKFIQVTVLLLMLAITIIYQKQISDFVVLNFVYKKEIIVENSNQYKLDYNFQYFSTTDNFMPNNKKQLINVLYTILNNGWEDFTFFCGMKYENCINDIDEISRDTSFLSNLNNFIHPFNSYNIIYTNYNTLGRISIKVDKAYNNHEIEMLENKVDEIYNKIIKDNMNTREKILTIHDYIIGKTSYDTERAEAITSMNDHYVPIYQSHKAVGPLIQEMAICGGYSDAMALFLIKMGIPNYKIANKVHIWNYVYLDGSWYHLDLTWDDPVASNKQQLLIHDYFLITTEKLFSLKNNHDFEQNIFLEASLNPNI
ncbi:MAG: hypothetical protein PHX03_00615 [Bacilli bacterium]|nr:hypothetical protein [Bacilli bacterium]